MMKLETWIVASTKKLEQAGISTPRLDVQVLVCETLKCSKVWLLSHPEHELSPKTTQTLDNHLKQKLQHIPIAYIFGHKEFYGRPFIITKNVLIPRPESESLIEIALKISDPTLRVIDIGCGSGVLGITIALEKPLWNISLSDISSDALATAADNVKKYGLDDHVRLIEQYFLGKNQGFDLIIANLPYVPESMHNNDDLRAEPAIALFSGVDGLDHYRQLFSIISDIAIKPKHIITEALESQHFSLTQLARENGYQLTNYQGLAQHFEVN